MRFIVYYSNVHTMDWVINKFNGFFLPSDVVVYMPISGNTYVAPVPYS